MGVVLSGIGELDCCQGSRSLTSLDFTSCYDFREWADGSLSACRPLFVGNGNVRILSHFWLGRGPWLEAVGFSDSIPWKARNHADATVPRWPCRRAGFAVAW